jgi:HSP20 family protein
MNHMTDLTPTTSGRGYTNMFGPLDFIRREMDRLFDQAGGNGAWASPFARNGAAPQMDVSETDTQIDVVAELPGIEAKDVEVTLANGVLTIKGEKRSERDDSKADYRLIERTFGAFERRIPVPESCDRAKVKADFANGVLKISITKPVEAQKSAKRIPINQAS